MKILALCHEYPPIGGGGGVGVKQYAEAWASQGHEVTVLTSWRAGLDLQEETGGVEVIRVPTFHVKNRATVTFTSMLLYVALGLCYVLWRIRRFRGYHVINTHFALPTGLLGVLLSRLLHLPNVLTIIGGDIYDPTKKSSPHRHLLTRAVNSFIMNAAQRVVAISGDTKRRAEQYYRVRKSIEVITYGFIPLQLPAAEISGRDRSDGKFYLIAVGRLIKRKGFDYLIQALTLLPAEVILLIVGDGPLEGHLKSITTKANLNDRVVFLGYLSRDRVYQHLKNADCFVLSSLHEGLGIVVQEAMYAGLPIVSTDNGGQVDLIKNPRNGILVKPEDSEGLAEAIKKFYLDRTLAEAVGANNREDVKMHYMMTNAGKYIQIFEELAGELDLSVLHDKTEPGHSYGGGKRLSVPLRTTANGASFMVERHMNSEHMPPAPEKLG